MQEPCRCGHISLLPVQGRRHLLYAHYMPDRPSRLPCYKLKGKIAESADKRKRNYIYKCTSAKYFFQTLHHPVYQVNNRKIKENAALLAKHYEYGREIEPFILLFFLSTTIFHFQFFIFNLLNLSFYRISSLVCGFDECNKSPTRHNT